MKDFHDLYSLIRLDVLDSALAKKSVQLVFHHRKTPLKKLPVAFGKDAFETLEKNWTSYRDTVTDNFRVINPKDFRVLA